MLEVARNERAAHDDLKPYMNNEYNRLFIALSGMSRKERQYHFDKVVLTMIKNWRKFAMPNFEVCRELFLIERAIRCARQFGGDYSEWPRRADQLRSFKVYIGNRLMFVECQMKAELFIKHLLAESSMRAGSKECYNQIVEALVEVNEMKPISKPYTPIYFGIVEPQGRKPNDGFMSFVDDYIKILETQGKIKLNDDGKFEKAGTWENCHLGLFFRYIMYSYKKGVKDGFGEEDVKKFRCQLWNCIEGRFNTQLSRSNPLSDNTISVSARDKARADVPKFLTAYCGFNVKPPKI